MDPCNEYKSRRVRKIPHHYPKSCLHLSQDDKATVQVGTTTIKDTSQTLSSLGLKHGSLITITPPRHCIPNAQPVDFKIEKSNRFDPFPDLARDYQMAIRRKAQRGTTGKNVLWGFSPCAIGTPCRRTTIRRTTQTSLHVSCFRRTISVQLYSR